MGAAPNGGGWGPGISLARGKKIRSLNSYHHQKKRRRGGRKREVAGAEEIVERGKTSPKAIFPHQGGSLERNERRGSEEAS